MYLLPEWAVRKRIVGNVEINEGYLAEIPAKRRESQKERAFII